MPRQHVPIAFALSLCLGSVALAAPPAARPPAPASPHTASPAQGKPQACEAAWKAQKTHHGTHAAHMKACVAKG